MESMLIDNKCHRGKHDTRLPVKILSNFITPPSHPRNLGVNFDTFNFLHHINNNVKSCNYYIRDIAHIHKHLSLQATINIILENTLVFNSGL